MAVRARLAATDSLDRETLALGALVLNTELLAVLAYYLLANARLVDPRFTIYGLVWVNVGLVVLVTLDAPEASTRQRRRAGAVAVGYVAVLAVAGGLVGPAADASPAGFSIVALPPGWGPALAYGGAHVDALLMPAKVVGYAALGALVYATVLDASRAAVSGVLGLFSCVSCSWPVLAGVATAVAGGGSAVAAATTPLSYDLSTLVFVVTVALLRWRPLAR